MRLNAVKTYFGHPAQRMLHVQIVTWIFLAANPLISGDELSGQCWCQRVGNWYPGQDC